MKISIIIPANNEEKYIKKCLDSIKKAYIITSCRKFDKYGDWHWFKFILFKPIKAFNILKGKDKNFISEYFYNFKK